MSEWVDAFKLVGYVLSALAAIWFVGQAAFESWRDDTAETRVSDFQGSFRPESVMMANGASFASSSGPQMKRTFDSGALIVNRAGITWQLIFRQGNSIDTRMSAVTCAATYEVGDGLLNLTVTFVSSGHDTYVETLPPTELDYTELCGVSPSRLPEQQLPFVLMKFESPDGREWVVLQNVAYSFYFVRCDECDARTYDMP